MARKKNIANTHMLGVRIEEDVFIKLEKMARPETISTLVRKVLRELVKTKPVK